MNRIRLSIFKTVRRVKNRVKVLMRPRNNNVVRATSDYYLARCYCLRGFRRNCAPKTIGSSRIMSRTYRSAIETFRSRRERLVENEIENKTC